MTQAQAIVTAVIRVAAAGAVLLALMISPRPGWTAIPVDAWNSAGMGTKSADFAGGTIVHVNWIGIATLALCLLAFVFARRIAPWITPAHKET